MSDIALLPFAQRIHFHYPTFDRVLEKLDKPRNNCVFVDPSPFSFTVDSDLVVSKVRILREVSSGSPHKRYRLTDQQEIFYDPDVVVGWSFPQPLVGGRVITLPWDDLTEVVDDLSQ
jgi:hypothetical protein